MPNAHPVFSRQTEFPSEPNPLMLRRWELQRAGQHLVDLSASNPTSVGLDFDPTWLNVLSQPRTLAYDPEPFGMLEAREALAARWARRGAKVAADNIVLSSSTSEAYGFLFKLLCDPGDEILVPCPSYPLFEHLAQLEHVRVVNYPLRYDGAWYFDLDALRELCTARTKAVVLVSPNNPTGSVTRDDELAAIDALGLPVISDEVFASFLFGAGKSRFRTALGLEKCLVFVLDGLSKSLGLPQCKLAWTTLSGPPPLVAAARERLEVIADAYLSVSTSIQVGLPALLQRETERHATLQTRLARNLTTLREATLGTAVTVLQLDGGWSAILRLPNTRSESEWVLTLLERDGIWVQPGWYFDLTPEAHIVVSLLTPPEVFADAIGRIVRRVDAEL
jgi:aspartate/methionine/tyrosine aminotransferase